MDSLIENLKHLRLERQKALEDSYHEIPDGAQRLKAKFKKALRIQEIDQKIISLKRGAIRVVAKEGELI